MVDRVHEILRHYAQRRGNEYQGEIYLAVLRFSLLSRSF